VPPRFFPDDSIWYQDITRAPVDPESSQVVKGLAAKGGFGLGKMIVDFDLEVLTADDAVPMMDFMPARGFYEPDCDLMPVPVPPNGALENEPGYTCITGGDCHLIVHHVPTKRLYEMWRADLTHGVFTGGCLAVWDLTRTYGPVGRGHNCTSADAAGYPIAPLLFSADEVAAGEIPHAVRLILPNDRIRKGVYVFPATHSTGAVRGGPDTPPYGARFRLRADYPVHTLGPGAQVVARALQRYGMLLADGGNKALTARSDRFTENKWAGRLGAEDLAALQVTDFEMIDGGTRYPFTADCVREPPILTP
jgi:serine/threonine-protein kinase